MTSGNASALSRRDFFRRSRPAAIAAPPAAVADAVFMRSCDGCGECVPVCEEGVLGVVEGKARIDFARGECTFCGDCVDACDRGALNRAALASWAGRPNVSGACIGRAGVICRACGDACPRGAVRFAIAVAGSAPLIDLAACNGCGACVAPCPVGAIAVTKQEQAA